VRGPTGSDPQDVTYTAGQQFPNPPNQVLVYFSAWSPGHGRQLWKSNGTAAGTVMVTDDNPGRGGLAPQDIAPVADGYRLCRAASVIPATSLRTLPARAASGGIRACPDRGGLHPSRSSCSTNSSSMEPTARPTWQTTRVPPTEAYPVPGLLSAGRCGLDDYLPAMRRGEHAELSLMLLCAGGEPRAANADIVVRGHRGRGTDRPGNG
jgi:ELWxxDGT repeat protein